MVAGSTAEGRALRAAISECCQSGKLKGESRGLIKPRVRQRQQQLVARSIAVGDAVRDAKSWRCQS